MNLQFSCPNCGLVMQAATDSAGGTAQCPQCGQTFMVEASPPVVPVVKAQVVSLGPTPALAPPPPPPSQAAISAPHAPVRPPMGRPAPVHQPHPHVHYEAPPVRAASNNDRVKIIGLVVAGVVVLFGFVWLTQVASTRSSNAAAEEVRQEAAEKKRQDDALAALVDQNRINESAVATKQQEKDQMVADAKKLAEAADREKLKELALEKEERAKEISGYAVKHFGGDMKAAESFRTMLDVVRVEVVDSLEKFKTADDLQAFLAERIVWHLKRDEVLAKWMKDNGRVPEKFGPELAGYQKPSPGAFDFSKYSGSGSGFFISDNGWLLTNHHVVTDAKTVDLRLPDGKIVQATVVKTDEEKDLALLKADLSTASWLALPKIKDDFKQGRNVFTVGYPSPSVQGVASKMTAGRINATSGIGDSKDSYETSVPVQHGNSGGALVDFKTGLLVGVINSKLGSTDTVSYAIKGRVVAEFLDSVSAAKTAVERTPPPPLKAGDEQPVIDRTVESAVLVLRRR